MAKKLGRQYQLKIVLNGSKPPIWRRVLVDSAQDLAHLHRVIQVSMGWDTTHLYQFIHNGEFYSEPSPFDDDMETLDASEYRMDSLLRKEKDAIRYEYDFGDGWLHKITLEKIFPLDDTVSLPVCVTGKRACPPEDVGGVWGYESFLEAIKDENHPEHEDMLEWCGYEFNPEEFDPQAVNEMFRVLSR